MRRVCVRKPGRVYIRPLSGSFIMSDDDDFQQTAVLRKPMKSVNTRIERQSVLPAPKKAKSQSTNHNSIGKHSLKDLQSSAPQTCSNRTLLRGQPGKENQEPAEDLCAKLHHHATPAPTVRARTQHSQSEVQALPESHNTAAALTQPFSIVAASQQDVFTGTNPQQAFCPVCECFLPEVAKTVTGQAAHINACLDQLAAASPRPLEALQACTATSSALAAHAGQQHSDEADLGSEAGEDGDVNWQGWGLDTAATEDWAFEEWLEPEAEGSAVPGITLGGLASRSNAEAEPVAICSQLPGLTGSDFPLGSHQHPVSVVQPAGAFTEQPSCSAVVQWLSGMGLERYAATFTQAGIHMRMLPTLGDSHLQQLGVTPLGPRKRILAAAAALHRTDSLDADPQPTFSSSGAQAHPAAAALHTISAIAPDAAVQPCDTSRPVSSSNPPLPARACTAVAVGSGGDAAVAHLPEAHGPRERITDYFRRPPGAAPAGLGGIGGGLLAAARDAKQRITDYFARPDGAPVPKAPSILAATVTACRGGQASTSSGFSGRGRWVPEWQMVPGTNFVVDRFGAKAQEGVHCRHWFLTHFHADHYGGLSGRFKAGLIYCTPITARLVEKRLHVPWARLQVVKLNEPITVEGVRITFIDANHCPGAAMILFDIPGRPPVLHTGDCRLQRGMQAEASLQGLRARAILVLDTTYCAPQYTFPPQDEVVRFVLGVVRAEAFNPRTLFLFGTYTIGKERLFLEIARILKKKVYVSREKRAVMGCLDLKPDYAALLTTDDKEACMHAVPMRMISLQGMTRILQQYKGRYTTVVGFQPTGWTQQAERGRAGARGRRRQQGTLITYQVPYSEHSSFTEMREFVKWLQPSRIIPSVGNDRGPKTAAMLALLQPLGSRCI